jgi:hypothetical protein
MLLNERAGESDHVLGLGVEQADRLDPLAQPLLAEATMAAGVLTSLNRSRVARLTLASVACATAPPPPAR